MPPKDHAMKEPLLSPGSDNVHHSSSPPATPTSTVAALVERRRQLRANNANDAIGYVPFFKKNLLL